MKKILAIFLFLLITLSIVYAETYTLTVEDLCNLGDALCNDGKYDEAERIYVKALKIDDKNPYVWIGMGNASRGQKEYEMALVYYEIALKIDPNFISAWNEKGNFYSLQEKYEEAMKCYDMALKIKPDYIIALYNTRLWPNHAT